MMKEGISIIVIVFVKEGEIQTLNFDSLKWPIDEESRERGDHNIRTKQCYLTLISMNAHFQHSFHHLQYNSGCALQNSGDLDGLGLSAVCIVIELIPHVSRLCGHPVRCPQSLDT